ncbi:MAG: amidase family protein [Pseudomonadota bacterium]
MEDWLWMRASDLGRGIARREIDPVALCKTYLDAIDTHPLRDRVYARVTAERALAEAEAAAQRAQSGHRLSALDGVPVSWKDLFDTAGIATEAGSRLLKGRIPSEDAQVLANATAAGLVCLGKTHMSELAFSGLGHNPMTATPPCVNNASAVSGGSSSGAAASVAFGLAAAAIGSDTGGSVRIPSAWNDLVGLKTTSGRLSLDGVVPLAPRFDTVGPLCRSVEDATNLFAILGSEKPVDLGGASLAGRRLAALETVAMDDVRDAPKAAYEAAIERLSEAGAEILPLDLPDVAEASQLSGVLFTTEAYGHWREVIEAEPEAMFHEVRERFRLGRGYTGPDYVAAWVTLDRLREKYARATAHYDAVLLPSSPIMPPDLERLMQDHDYYVTENLLALRNTRIGNLMGLCALSLPCGAPSCGLMLMCAANTEHALLRLGVAVEHALNTA